MEQVLSLVVRLHSGNVGFIAAAGAQVANRLGVHREQATGGTVFGGHVGNGGAVGQRQAADARAVELDKLAHHAVLAQHFGHGQHQVGGRGTFAQAAGQAEAHHLRDEHGHRLAEHGGFGFDAPDAPTQHAQTVDHRRVAVRAHQRIKESRVAIREDHAGQVLQVHLVANAGVGRHHLKVIKRPLPPLEELVALGVALVFQVQVDLQRGVGAVLVHLHAVVNDELHRLQRIDALRVAAEFGHGVAHGGEVDHAGHPGEVLQKYAGGGESDFVVRFRLRVPVQQGFDIGGAGVHAVF